jgi:hypothetical protein
LLVELLVVLLVDLLAELGVVLLAPLGVALLAELGVDFPSGGLVDLELADPVFWEPESAVPDFVLSVLVLSVLVELGFVELWLVELWLVDRGFVESFEVDLVVCEFDGGDFGSGFLVTLAGGSWPSIAATVGKFHPNHEFKRGCRRK